MHETMKASPVHGTGRGLGTDLIDREERSVAWKIYVPVYRTAPLPDRCPRLVTRGNDSWRRRAAGCAVLPGTAPCRSYPHLEPWGRLFCESRQRGNGGPAARHLQGATSNDKKVVPFPGAEGQRWRPSGGTGEDVGRRAAVLPAAQTTPESRSDDVPAEGRGEMILQRHRHQSGFPA